MVRPLARVLLLLGAVATPSLSLLLTPRTRRRPTLRLLRSSAASTDVGGSGSGSSSSGQEGAEAALRTGMAKMESVMSADFFASSASLNRMRSSIVKSTRVGPSSIRGAGRGLFATKNIKAGTVVSFYPAHSLGMEMGGNGEQMWVTGGADGHDDGGDREYFAANPPSSSAYLHATDQPIFGRPSLVASVPGVEEGSPLYLDVNPNREVDPAWVSQYINDGATVESGTEEGVAAYYVLSKKRKNCVHAPFGPSPVMATVATRKIKKGEELFTSYGCVYWLGTFDPERDGDGGGGVGDDDPRMTDQIQSQIVESAEDLFKCMKSVETTYSTEVEDFKTAFDELQ